MINFRYEKFRTGIILIFTTIRMDQSTFLKQKAEASAVATLTGTAVTTKYILVTCRSLTTDESAILAKNFKTIIVYHALLNAAQMDLTQMTFDLLVLDASDAANHTFLETVTPSCVALNIPILVLKKSYSNYADLVAGLNATSSTTVAYPISRIQDLTGANFFLSLLKTKLPKLESRVITLLKKVFAAFFS